MLRIQLFGPIQVTVDSKPLGRLRSRKGLWLLALLALRANRNIDRGWLAGTLWPEDDEDHARRSLRQSLHDLRLALGDEAWRLAGGERRTLRLDLSDAQVDVLAFDAAVASGDAVQLAEAVGMYRGRLLEDCAEDWIVEDRQRREAAYISALETLASSATQAFEHEAAAGYLRRAVAVDPFREELQRALMEALAVDGSPAAALMAYRQYRALLGREMAAEPGEPTTALFRRLRDEARTRATPDAAAQTRPLPHPLTALIGRDEAVAEVLALMDRARLVTLVGPGGIGKTRLALQVARRLAGRYADGAVFVELAPVAQGAGVADAVRAALGVRAPDTEGPEAALRQHLAARHLLLVLDNCEHLAAPCAALAEGLLRDCPGLRVLATSRQRLDVRGESVWRVPGLAIPDDEAPGAFALLLRCASVRLFVERAQAAGGSFAWTEASAPAVVRLCRALDGIPLALELAAARASAMPVETIARRLHDRFRPGGASGGTGASERHQTLRASMDWSYDLLAEPERILLRRLSVFNGGWTLDAAEAVCSEEPIREWEVLDLLSALVSKSLVVYEGAAESRYRLLETVRQYGNSRLTPDERSAIQQRHLAHFLALADEAEPNLTGPRQSEWMDRLAVELENLRAAIDGAVSGQAALRILGGLTRFWELRGYLTEGRARLARALDAAPEPTPDRARALNAAGILAYRQADYEAARAYHEESLLLRRALGSRAGVASSLNNLATIVLEQGRHEAAQELYAECLAISREIGNQWGIATCLHNLGICALELEDYDVCRACHEESLALRRALGDRAGIAYSLNSLGTVAFRQGHLADARALHEESLAIKRELGDRSGAAHALHGLGKAALALGDERVARTAQRESLSLRHALGDRVGIAESLECLADLTAGPAAARLLGAAEALRERIGAPLPPCDREEYDTRVERLRGQSDPASFARAWAEGRTLSVEETVADILEPSA